MKVLKLTTLLLVSFCTVISTQSCIDECDNQICQNGGTCENGTCLCLDGFLGTNCEVFDDSKVQALLNRGKSPKELYDGNVILDSLYGKMYEGGLIFYLNTANGSGMVATAKDLVTEDQNDRIRWGCPNIDIVDLNNVRDFPLNPEKEEMVGARVGDGMSNTNAILANCNEDNIAAKLCAELILNGKDDWFLPSRGELHLMRINLSGSDANEWVNLNLGGFRSDIYWSSTEYFYTDAAWGEHFFSFPEGRGNDWKNASLFVRAVRTF